MTHPTAEHLEAVGPLLAVIYFICAILNLGEAWRSWHAGNWRGKSVACLGATLVFVVLSGCSIAGNPPQLASGIKVAIDAVIGPITLFLAAFVLLAAMVVGRRFIVLPSVALAAFDGLVLFFGLSLADPVFAAIVGRPDHIPIVGMVALLGCFTWIAAYQAVENDRRMAAGKGPVEETYSEKVLVWPDLVYIELIVMVALVAVLIAWSLLVAAPLEAPANPAVTPNPSKAPWYFLGLQEWLVYADAWYVGFVVPCLIVLGLVAIPYLDVSPRGSGYYTISQRSRPYQAFMLGFFLLWVLPILVGTFMRGPNWSFFGLYEPRDPQKMVMQANVSLSEYFWGYCLNRPSPRVDPDAGVWLRMGQAAWREIAGLVFLAVYLIGTPLLVGRTWAKSPRCGMDRARYWTMMLLCLLLLILPLKMVLRWTLNLSHIVSMPEFQMNL